MCQQCRRFPLQCVLLLICVQTLLLRRYMAECYFSLSKRGSPWTFTGPCSSAPNFCSLQSTPRINAFSSGVVHLCRIYPVCRWLGVAIVCFMWTKLASAMGSVWEYLMNKMKFASMEVWFSSVKVKNFSANDLYRGLLNPKWKAFLRQAHGLASTGFQLFLDLTKILLTQCVPRVDV